MTSNHRLPSRKKLSVPGKLLLLANIGATMILVAAILSYHIDPQVFWVFAIFGLAFFIFYTVNVFFAIVWLLIRPVYSLISVGALVAGFTILRGIIGFAFASDTSGGNVNYQAVKLMSYNVRMFDLYNWSHNHETRVKIFDLVKGFNPGIICIQEFYTSDKGDFKNLEDMLELMNSRYYHFEKTTTLRKTDHWGIATFSKYPIINRGKIQFEGKTQNIAIWSDIKIDADTIRVFNTHLQSIYFRGDDYELIKNFSDKDEQQQLTGSRKIIRKLKRAFVARSNQAKQLKIELNRSPYPVVLCGDFNDTPSSFTYSHLTANLADAFKESGSGFGQTYAGAFPSFRIDYILHDKRIFSDQYNTIRDPLSDHYPISCELLLPGLQ
jgi:endonuclease/exonuclease/phosphatase family metal-dependent hydrolase